MSEVFPKTRIKRVYYESGEAAASKLAKELKITEGKLRRWFSEWGGQSNDIKKTAAPANVKRGVGARVKLTRYALGPEHEGDLGKLIPRSGATHDPFTIRLDDGFTFDARDYEFEYVETAR